MVDRRQVVAVHPVVAGTGVGGRRFRRTCRGARGHVESARRGRADGRSGEDRRRVEVRAVHQFDAGVRRVVVRRILIRHERVVRVPERLLVLVDAEPRAEDHLPLEAGLLEVLLLRARGLELHLQEHVVERRDQAAALHRDGGRGVVADVVDPRHHLAGLVGVGRDVVVGDLVRPAILARRGGRRVVVGEVHHARPAERRRAAHAEGVVEVRHLGDERGQRERQLAARALHLREVAERRPPQVVLEAVEQRGPHPLLLLPLQALVLRLDVVAPGALAGVQFDLVVGPRHVVDREAPRALDRVQHLRVAPVERVVRQVVVVGGRVIEHDDIADLVAALNGGLGGLVLEEPRERIGVLDGLVDHGIGRGQVGRPGGRHEVIEGLEGSPCHDSLTF